MPRQPNGLSPNSQIDSAISSLASGGCSRLSVGTLKWVCSNCRAAGT
jgi:hypothetical protein